MRNTGITERKYDGGPLEEKESSARHLLDTPDRRACLVNWKRNIGIPDLKLTITLVVEDGVIQKTVASGGLWLPTCARLDGKPLPDGHPTEVVVDLGAL